MNPRLKALVAIEDGLPPANLDQALSADRSLHVLEYLRGLRGAHPALGEKGADLVIVACSAQAEGAVSLIEDSVAKRPERPVVVFQFGDAEANGFMQEVFAAGADDIVSIPDEPEHIRHVLQKAIARRRSVTLNTGDSPSALICVLGPKGGTGKTVTSINLAVVLAEGGSRTVLVDLDLHFGDVGLGLRLSPERTVYDLARSGGTLDVEKLDDYLVPHASQVRTLLAPTRPDHAGAVTPELMGEILAVLRASNDVVVVDTPAGFPPEVITAIDSSTHICMVGMLDAFSLKDTKLGLETLDRMGYDEDAVKLVLNRADSHVGIDAGDVEAVLGRKPTVLVPSHRDVPRSLTDGEPIVWKATPAAKALRSLGELYMAELAVDTPGLLPAPSPRRRSLLRRA